MTGVIGVGKMGAAIAGGLAAGGGPAPGGLLVFDRDERLAGQVAAGTGARLARGIAELVRASETVVLAVKPQDRLAPVSEIRRALEPGRVFVLVSVLAGVPTAWFEENLGEVPVVRVMPNLGIRVGRGMSFFSPGRFTPAAGRAEANRIFGALGKTAEVAEEMMDLVTAVSGSGPAYFFRLMEIMADFARAAGLDAETAATMVQVTAESAALLARDRDPADLKREVTSSGGTTEAALKTLDDGRWAEILRAALAAAVKRGGELSGRGQADARR